MNPRFDTTMRTAFQTAASKAIRSANLDDSEASHQRYRFLSTVCNSIDRGVGAPRPKRAH